VTEPVVAMHPRTWAQTLTEKPKKINREALDDWQLNVVGMWSLMIDVIRPLFQTLRGKVYPSSEIRGEIIFHWSDRKAD
jgi:hypothetical protein